MQLFFFSLSLCSHHVPWGFFFPFDLPGERCLHSCLGATLFFPYCTAPVYHSAWLQGLVLLIGLADWWMLSRAPLYIPIRPLDVDAWSSAATPHNGRYL